MTHPKLSATDAERLLERCGGDPQFEERLRAVYRGRHDVLDALWWAAHPLTESPRGTPDPAGVLLGLRRDVYSRPTDASALARESEQRLGEAERFLSDDARLLAEAAQIAEPATVSAPKRGTDSEPDETAASFEAGEASAGQGPEPEAAARPRRKYLLPVLSATALLAAVLILPSLSGMNAESDPEPTPTPPSAERVRTEIVTIGSDGNVGDPLAILERPQTEEDVPPDSPGLRFEPGAYRAIPDLVDHVDLFVARGREELICLVAIRREASGETSGSSTCLSESEFSTQPLQLGGGRFDLGDGGTILTESYVLFADGAFRYEATVRVDAGEVPFGGSPEESIDGG